MEITADFNDIFWEPPETEYQPLLDFESEIFREVPHNDIAVLTQRIKRSFLDYVRQGIMMDAVRRHRLYKRQYKDFADYCQNALGRSHFYCKKIIQAAQVCLELIKSNFKILPTSVSQALPLVKFAKIDAYGSNQLGDKWQTVLDGFPDHQITTAKIQETLDENPEDRAKQVRIGGKAYQILEQKAVAAGMTVSQYLEMLIGNTQPPDEEPPDDELCNDQDTELTPEQEEICNEVEAFIKTKSVINRGFGIESLSKSYQKAGKLNRAGEVPDSC